MRPDSRGNMSAQLLRRWHVPCAESVQSRRKQHLPRLPGSEKPAIIRTKSVRKRCHSLAPAERTMLARGKLAAWDSPLAVTLGRSGSVLRLHCNTFDGVACRCTEGAHKDATAKLVIHKDFGLALQSLQCVAFRSLSLQQAWGATMQRKLQDSCLRSKNVNPPLVVHCHDSGQYPLHDPCFVDAG